MRVFAKAHRARDYTNREVELIEQSIAYRGAAASPPSVVAMKAASVLGRRGVRAIASDRQSAAHRSRALRLLAPSRAGGRPGARCRQADPTRSSCDRAPSPPATELSGHQTDRRCHCRRCRSSRVRHDDDERPGGDRTMRGHAPPCATRSCRLDTRARDTAARGSEPNPSAWRTGARQRSVMSAVFSLAASEPNVHASWCRRCRAAGVGIFRCESPW